LNRCDYMSNYQQYCERIAYNPQRDRHIGGSVQQG
jgi:hypothetical protein